MVKMTPPFGEPSRGVIPSTLGFGLSSRRNLRPFDFASSRDCAAVSSYLERGD